MTFIKKCIISTSCVVIYVFSFEIIYLFARDAAAAFNVFPAALFGWLFGMLGGIIYGIISFPLNLILFISVGNLLQSQLLPSFVSGIAFALVGAGVGWMKILNEKIQYQSDELQREKKLLQEEIVKRMRVEELLSYESLHDPLTSLPNRRLLYNRIEHALAWSKRNPNNLSTLIYLDLNKFKPVNDQFGHGAGDQLLKEVAIRMKATVREIDTVSRMGGDEFAILLEAASNEESSIAIINRIQESFEKTFEWDNYSVSIGTSMGVVIDISNYDQIEDIVKDADFAMYYAKKTGMVQYKIFDPNLREIDLGQTGGAETR